jgi:hypothetical protein
VLGFLASVDRRRAGQGHRFEAFVIFGATAMSACGGAGAAVQDAKDSIKVVSGTIVRRGAEVPPAEGAFRQPYAYCRAVLEAHRIDLDAENGPALATALNTSHLSAMPYDVIVVPGYTPLDEMVPVPALHPVAQSRLLSAVSALRTGYAPLILVSGGNVHPADTPFNEALEMKRFLLGQGVPSSAIVVEPCARHSHTNLRNAGRFMISTGLRTALVVTSWDQSMYFGRARFSSFDARCIADLGYVVGSLYRIENLGIAFVPSGRVVEQGPDALDP